jgi:anti-sigma regulatory factor (Ser/Thr protein kinase)
MGLARTLDQTGRCPIAADFHQRYHATDDTPRVARHELATHLRRHGFADLIPNASLAVSELVTNAVMYASGPIELRASIDGARLHVEVADLSAALPHMREPLFGGYGLHVVDNVATAWGVDPISGDGKITWFDLEPP